MKYWRFHCYTCYCGEEEDFYDEAENLEAAEPLAWLALDGYALECYDGQAEEDYDNDYDAYLAECGVDIYEISYEEYAREVFI